jgi:hypothetical protein
MPRGRPRKITSEQLRLLRLSAEVVRKEEREPATSKDDERLSFDEWITRQARLAPRQVARRRTDRALQDQFYVRRAIRILCQGSEVGHRYWRPNLADSVSRTWITDVAKERWPWLFQRARQPGYRPSLYAGCRKRWTVLAALGRCDATLIQTFADQLCVIRPKSKGGSRLIRTWRTKLPQETMREHRSTE